MKKKGETVCLMKEKYLTTSQVLARRDRKTLYKNSNGKSRHSTIHYRENSS